MHRTHSIFTLLILIGCALFIGNIYWPKGNGSPKPSVELTVLAASSMTDTVTKLASLYEKEHPEIKILPTYASSGTLQKQIEEGAPGDLLLSAGEQEMRNLIQAHLINNRLHTNLLTNQLVLIAPSTKSKIKRFDDLKRSSIQQVIIGQPKTVPAGRYAKQTLTSLKLMDHLHSKMIFAGDVRQVLASVQTGNADAGLVYLTDTLGQMNIRVIDSAPPKSHDPIRYPIGVIRNTEHPKEAKQLYKWLQSKKALQVFHQAGFQTLRKPFSL
ncbi:molybdate transport system substrate-binding protein [Marininema mesophilum]|uniref:Molybdate transport system substrate-binding protein n=1 Tax=Marininema mesophilum TaxID=1048340 RepID=A0A1H2YK40_9BACL|nr:molybdate ABC transporter substrate-binding protein [Marininema mesophilum]SDX05526.1 molybdate transport system substrate-binding protein [Marininema mesophilum]